MGLTGTEHGAKAVFKNKFRNEAFFEFASLAALTAAAKAPAASVVCVVDGNVMIRSAPESIRTVEGFVRFCRSQIDRMFQAVDHVIVVFDEPENLSTAKAVEQMRRDASRKTSQILVCSSDTAKLPTTDAYLIGDIDASIGVRDLINTRSTRSRVFDEVSMKLFEHYKRQFKQALPEAAVRTFTLDGIDRRGGERRVDEAREVEIASTRTRAAQALARTTPVGEGDIKLTVVVDSILADRETDGSLFADVKTFILHTIDTDSIVIEMAAQMRRKSAEVGDFGVYLTLRERAKRGRDGEDGEASYYAVFDVRVMTNLMIKYLFTLHGDPDAVPMVLQRKAVALVTLAAVMCGCDFSCFKGLRFDEVLQNVQQICTDDPAALACMHAAWDDCDAELLRVSATVKHLLDASATRLSTVPRRKTHCASLKRPNELEVLRSLWTLGYWHGHERKNVVYWGFPNVVPLI